VSFKDTLAGKRKSPVAIFHKFRTDSSIYSKRHVFVEGYEDITFYSRHVPRATEGPTKFHICFGKKNLDKVADLYWGSDIETALVSFIRDSDFDAFLGNAPAGRDLFLTCGYAVENYIFSRDAIREYLRAVFCLDEMEVNFDPEVAEYVDFVERFHAWLSPIYGAAMFAAVDGRNIDLNQLDTERHVKTLLAGNPLPEPQSLEEIQNIGLVSTDFNADSAELGARFSALSALQWMRGKYLMTAASVFLRCKEDVYRERHKSGAISQFNRKAASNMSDTAVLDRLMGIAHPSSRLSEFLREGVISPPTSG